jgi:WhiB family transcriptional regulator, redox-sensing transcriptional regulator
MTAARLEADRRLDLTVRGTGDQGWRAHAVCRTPSAVHFFAPAHFERKPEKDAREGAARALCRSCPVQPQCLEYSLAVEEPHGIWGGLNELERRRLLRKRAAAGQQRSA